MRNVTLWHLAQTLVVTPLVAVSAAVNALRALQSVGTAHTAVPVGTLCPEWGILMHARCTAMKLIQRHIRKSQMALPLHYLKQRLNDNAPRMHPDQFFVLPGSKSQASQGGVGEKAARHRRRT
jgi:hypothetical protein